MELVQFKMAATAIGLYPAQNVCKAVSFTDAELIFGVAAGA